MKKCLLTRRAKLKWLTFALLSAAIMPASLLAQAPSIPGLPSTITGTQSGAVTTGPLGTTYSKFAVSSATPIYAGNPSPLIPGTTYNAWCFNPYGYIVGEGGTFTNPVTYTAYNSYETDFWAKPGVGANASLDWHEINWVINNKAGHSGTLTPSPLNIQAVIWDILVPNYDTSDLGTAGTQLLSDAQTYGQNFVPGPGQLAAIPLYVYGINSNDQSAAPQDLFVEYPLPCVPNKPGIKITKCANVQTAKCTDKVTYTYTVTNTGNVTLTNIVVTDDNATPNYPQDNFTVGTISSLAPGCSKTLTATIYLPVTETAVDSNGNVTNHCLIKQVLPNGDIQVTLLEDTSLADNTWGFAATPDWTSGNSLWNHLSADAARFVFTDGQGNLILDFAADYISWTGQGQLGLSTAGLGGAGHLYWGDSSLISSITTTASQNLNRPTSDWGFTTNSPPPYYTNNWVSQCGYTVVIKQCAFGKYGFGDCKINYIQHGQCKLGNNYKCQPQPSCVKVTNTATATTCYQGQTVTATAEATVTETGPNGQCTPPPPPKCAPKPQCPQSWWKKCADAWQGCKWW